jgi:type IV secretion system protein VirB1
MKQSSLLLAVLLGCVSVSPAQKLTVTEFRALAKACVPKADSRDLLALARTESSLNPWALSVNRPAAAARRFGYASGRISLRHQPKTQEEAVRWARELNRSGATVSVGLLQVNAEHMPYALERLFDPCTNLRQGWAIFAAAYRREVLDFGPGQQALLAAFAAYNAGTPLAGFTNGYVSAILRNSF